MTTKYYYNGEEPLTPGVAAVLDEEESRHLVKVMRGRVGDEIIVFGNGGQYHARVTEIPSRSQAVVVPEDALEGLPAPSVSVTLLVPWIRGGKTELVVQKLTELGAARIVIFQATREVARGDEEKLGRLRRVAVEACKQCERIDVPAISLAGSLQNAVDLFEHIPPDGRLILHERIMGKRLSSAAQPLIESGLPILLASGPEGGWDPEEITALGAGATLVSLGPRILRAETAPIAAMAALLALSGDI